MIKNRISIALEQSYAEQFPSEQRRATDKLGSALLDPSSKEEPVAGPGIVILPHIRDIRDISSSDTASPVLKIEVVSPPPLFAATDSSSSVEAETTLDSATTLKMGASSDSAASNLIFAAESTSTVATQDESPLWVSVQQSQFDANVDTAAGDTTLGKAPKSQAKSKTKTAKTTKGAKTTKTKKATKSKRQPFHKLEALKRRALSPKEKATMAEVAQMLQQSAPEQLAWGVACGALEKEEQQIIEALQLQLGKEKFRIDTIVEASKCSLKMVRDFLHVLKAFGVITVRGSMVRFVELDPQVIERPWQVDSFGSHASLSVRCFDRELASGIIYPIESDAFNHISRRKVVALEDLAFLQQTRSKQKNPSPELYRCLIVCHIFGKILFEDGKLIFVPKKLKPRSVEANPSNLKEQKFVAPDSSSDSSSSPAKGATTAAMAATAAQAALDAVPNIVTATKNAVPVVTSASATNIATTTATKASTAEVKTKQTTTVPVMSLLATKLLQAGIGASISTDATVAGPLEVLSAQYNSVASTLNSPSMSAEVKPDQTMEAVVPREVTHQDGVADTGDADAIEAAADTEVPDDKQLWDSLPQHLQERYGLL